MGHARPNKRVIRAWVADCLNSMQNPLLDTGFDFLTESSSMVGIHTVNPIVEA